MNSSLLTSFQPQVQLMSGLCGSNDTNLLPADDDIASIIKKHKNVLNY